MTRRNKPDKHPAQPARHAPARREEQRRRTHDSSSTFAFLRDYRIGIGLSVALLGTAILPSGATKLVAVALGLTMIGGPGRLSRLQSGLLLFSSFVLAYVALPYWKLLPGSGAFGLGAALIAAATWAWLASGSIIWRAGGDKRETLWLAATLLVLVIVNIPGLRAPMPLMGDESYHRNVSVVARQFGSAEWHMRTAVLVVALGWAAWYLTRGEQRWRQVLGAALALLALSPFVLFLQRSWGEPSAGQLKDYLLRYPMFPYWQRILSISPPGGFIDMVVHRSASAAAHLAFAAVLFHSLRNSLPAAARAAVALAASTAPTLLNYSSTAYIELPLLALAIGVCMSIDQLLTRRWIDIVRTLPWLLLMLVGFQKESAAPYLAALVAAYALLQVVQALREFRIDRRPALLWARPAEIAIVCALIMTPILTYLAFRTGSGNPRAYAPNPKNLLLPEFLPLVGRASLEQFALIGPLAVLASVYLIFRGRWLFVLANLSVGLATYLFYATDVRMFIGYARFGLLMYVSLAAIFAAGTAELLARTNGGARNAIAGAIALVAVVQLMLSPVSLDGTRPRNWGLYLVQSGEMYYPMDQVFPWLRQTNATSAMFGGLRFDYDWAVNGNQAEWNGRRSVLPSQEISNAAGEKQALAAAAEKFRASGMQHLVWAVQTPELTTEEAVAATGLKLQKEFQNRHERMLVFTQ